MLPKTEKGKQMVRRFTISDDDPFAKIFDKKAFEAELANPNSVINGGKKKKASPDKKNVKFNSDSEDDDD
jgi:hypothetical protein